VEILREILRVVTSKSDPKKTLPELSDSPEENLTTRFLLGLHDGKYKNDDEAASDLYGSNHSDQRYRTLKSRTSERLIHALLFLQVKQPEHSEYLSYYYKCTRNLIAAQTLMRFASRKAGVSVAERALTVAKKYQFSDLCLALVALLRESAGIFAERKLFMAYNDELKYYLRLLEAEYKSDEYLDLLSMEFRHTRRTKAHLKELSESYVTEINELVVEYPSHNLRLNYYRLSLIYHEIRESFESIISTCETAISYLHANQHLIQKARLGEFGLTKMLNCIIIRRFADASSMSDEVIASFIEGGNNWYYAIDLSIISAIQSGDYGRAWSYYEKAVNHRSFPLQSQIVHELWNVYLAYLVLCEELGLVELPQTKKKAVFRLSSFLNSVPEFSKDKKVANLLIIVAQVSYLVIQGNFDQAEKRIDYLRVYMSRYLREREYNRTRAFLRMLNTFSRCSFEPKRIRSENEKYFTLLRETSNDPMPGDTNEIIPYEVLYEQLLQALERQLVET
jgi:hypothetical protein